MKASDLRIGNWLNWYSEYHCNGFFDKQLEIEDFTQTDLSSARPIPLTEEWHNKFGVVKNGFDSFEYELPRKNNISLKVIFTGDYVMLRQYSMDKIPMHDDVLSIWNKDLTHRDMYVHEWQNLYFALTGDELQLN